MAYKKEISKEEKAELQNYAKNADVLYKKGHLVEAGQMYAELSKVDAGYEKKIQQCAKELAAKKDDVGAGVLLAYQDKREAEGYADQLAKVKRYGEAGIVYMAAGNYKKAEQCKKKAGEEGKILDEYKILNAFIRKELKESGIAKEKE
jgi:tetratricopeptide (TPR) repeat protein